MAGPRFVVTGLGHSGTGWASRLFTALGAPCTHEGQITHTRCPRRPDGGESSWLAVGHLDVIDPEIPVVHLVRDPWAVLASTVRSRFLGSGPHRRTPHARFIYRARPVLDRPGPWARQVGWVARWDEPLGDRAGLRFRVEDANEATVAELLSHVGARVPTSATIRRVLDDLGTDTNAHDRDRPEPNLTAPWVQAAPDGARFLARAEALGYPPRPGG